MRLFNAYECWHFTYFEILEHLYLFLMKIIGAFVVYLYKNNRLFSQVTTSNHVIKELYKMALYMVTL